eukprot:865343-Pyramimonas_sp.AAC.1
MPVRAVLDRFVPNSSQPILPPWIAGLPEFGKALDDLLGQIPPSWGEWSRLSIAKEFFFDAGDTARRALRARPAVSLQEKHFWAMAALRAKYAHDVRRMCTACASMFSVSTRRCSMQRKSKSPSATLRRCKH